MTRQGPDSSQDGFLIKVCFFSRNGLPTRVFSSSNSSRSMMKCLKATVSSFTCNSVIRLFYWLSWSLFLDKGFSHTDLSLLGVFVSSSLFSFSVFTFPVSRRAAASSKVSCSVSRSCCCCFTAVMVENDSKPYPTLHLYSIYIGSWKTPLYFGAKIMLLLVVFSCRRKC